MRACISRVSSKGVTSEIVDVEALVREVIESVRPDDRSEVVVAGEWATVETMPHLLLQILTNLLTNALKFNDSLTKRVEIGSSAVEAGQVQLYVKDNGIGIAPRHHEKVFRVFERLHTQDEYDGTGIGLAIVKKSAATLGGSIRVESAPGRGSTFFVTLPLLLPPE